MVPTADELKNLPKIENKGIPKLDNKKIKKIKRESEEQSVIKIPQELELYI